MKKLLLSLLALSMMLSIIGCSQSDTTSNGISLYYSTEGNTFALSAKWSDIQTFVDAPDNSIFRYALDNASGQQIALIEVTKLEEEYQVLYHTSDGDSITGDVGLGNSIVASFPGLSVDTDAIATIELSVIMEGEESILAQFDFDQVDKFAWLTDTEG